MAVAVGCALLLAVNAASEWTCPEPSAEWCDPNASLDARVASLLSRLSQTEKVAQLQTTHKEGLDPVPYIPRLGLQEYTVRECLHGITEANMTVFPQSVSLAATWNAPLLKRVATAIGREARGLRNGFEAQRASGNVSGSPPALTCFSPQINIVRDPRWGRAQETYGESPALTGALARAYVDGLQGDNKRYLQAVATVKHFDAYGGATTRGERSPTEVRLSWRDWTETFLPAMRRVLARSDADERTAESTMCSYNTLCVTQSYAANESCPGPSHGVPACADHTLLTDVLRDRWGFDGYVVGDAGAIKFIQTDHEWADSQPAAAADAILAGADMALGGGCDPTNVPKGCISFGALPNATEQGLVNGSDIDRALDRVLRARFKLGLMDPPNLNPYTSIKPSIVDSPEHRALAREAALQSIVLLTNKDQTLPLGSAPTVAVVGPNSQMAAFGNYNGSNDNYSSVLDGVRRRHPHAEFSRGCDVASNDTSGFAAAVAAAKRAAVTIAVMGIDQSQEHETGTRKNITLPGVQVQLLREIRRQTETTLIVVLLGGSAMAVPWIKANADALVWAGYGGEEAGDAVADVLFGARSPGGRLPFTFYASDDQLPPFGDYEMRRAPGRTFRFLTAPPLFAFGFGLSYTKFEYTALVLSPSAPLQPCATLSVSARVRNVGGVAGDEVVQVYAAVLGRAGTDAPRLALGGFARTAVLAPDESEDVTMNVDAHALSYVEAKDEQGWLWGGPATVGLWIGARQPTIQEREARSADNKTLWYREVDLRGPSKKCGLN